SFRGVVLSSSSAAGTVGLACVSVRRRNGKVWQGGRLKPPRLLSSLGRFFSPPKISLADPFKEIKHDHGREYRAVAQGRRNKTLFTGSLSEPGNGTRFGAGERASPPTGEDPGSLQPGS